MEYDGYDDWYDNGPGSEAFKRSCLSSERDDPIETITEDKVDPAIRGEITLVITEKEDGNWYSELKPKILATEPRDMYKLALICASVQDHVSKNLAFMDTLIKTNEEVRKIHNELVEEKHGKALPAGTDDKGGYAAQPTTDIPIADVDKFQQPLELTCRYCGLELDGLDHSTCELG